VVRVRRQRRSPEPTAAPRYMYAIPAYGNPVVNEEHSQLRRLEPITCMYCRATGVDAIHGFTLESGTWQGEDIFRPGGLHGLHVVSERFARMVARHGLTNMRLRATAEYVWDPLGRGPARIGAS